MKPICHLFLFSLCIVALGNSAALAQEPLKLSIPATAVINGQGGVFTWDVTLPAKDGWRAIGERILMQPASGAMVSGQIQRDGSGDSMIAFMARALNIPEASFNKSPSPSASAKKIVTFNHEGTEGAFRAFTEDDATVYLVLSFEKPGKDSNAATQDIIGMLETATVVRKS